MTDIEVLTPKGYVKLKDPGRQYSVTTILKTNKTPFYKTLNIPNGPFRLFKLIQVLRINKLLKIDKDITLVRDDKTLNIFSWFYTPYLLEADIRILRKLMGIFCTKIKECKTSLINKYPKFWMIKGLFY
ncbi:unnamed protein product, partial [marine sediment metagenome]